MPHRPPAIILSGGSEIVALSIAEALLKKNVPIIVIALGNDKKLLRNINGLVDFRTMSWPPGSKNDAVKELKTIIVSLKKLYNYKFPVFPTEDGGLRLLVEARNELSDLLIISGSHKLKYGGLDKAELFDYLRLNGLSSAIPETITVKSIKEASEAIDKLDGKVIFKPALKPFSMLMENMPTKIIDVKDDNNIKDIKKYLKNKLFHAIGNSKTWVAQQKLISREYGELVWWGFRNKQDKIISMTACEVWKTPRYGGSGCWLESCCEHELNMTAEKITRLIDFYGVIEIPFLKDEHGKWKPLEINPRPWLQVALPEICGIPMIWMHYNDMINSGIYTDSHYNNTSVKSWINIERIVMAIARGEYGNRFSLTLKAIKAIKKADYIAVYSTYLKSVKISWIKSMIKKVLKWQL